MRIRSNRSRATTSTGQATAAKEADGAKKADFQARVDPDKEESNEEKARQIRSALMQELAKLAGEIEAGEATKEEASRRFVGMVIQDRFGEKNKGQGAKKMEDTIADLVESDPAFVSRLHNQLKKLAKS